MVKGTVIKQRNTIDVPNVNYRQLSALNVSMIKLFDTDPVKFFEQFKLGRKKKESKTTALAIGDLVDFYLLDCKGDDEEFDDRFDEKFALFEGTKGTGQVFTLADILFDITQENTDENGVITKTFDSMFSQAFTKVQAEGKYKGGTEDKALLDFKSKGLPYYTSLIDNMGKTVVDVSLLDKAKKVAKMLQKDPFTEDVFKDDDDDIEYFPKFPIEWKYLTSSGKSVDCKSELDILKINHSLKTIYPKDLKTTYDNEAFEYGYIKNGYYLQAAFYWLAVREWARENGMSDYHIEPMEFIVGDTSSNNRRPIRYQTSYADLRAAKRGFVLRGIAYRGIYELMDEIAWCEENNIWNVSKKVYEHDGKLELNLDYEEYKKE